MAYFERWRSQHDADAWLKNMGFEERLIHGIRIYFNERTGESLELDRPKYFFEKSIQHGVHISEGILERLTDCIKKLELDEKQTEALRDFYKNEKNILNNLKKDLSLRDND